MCRSRMVWCSCGGIEVVTFSLGVVVVPYSVVRIVEWGKGCIAPDRYGALAVGLRSLWCSTRSSGSGKREEQGRAYGSL